MRNFLIAIVLAISLISFFAISNNRPVTLQDEDDYSRNDSSLTDTVPAKKDSFGKRKSKKISYNSFGMTKKMDITKS